MTFLITDELQNLSITKQNSLYFYFKFEIGHVNIYLKTKKYHVQQLFNTRM